MSTLIVFLLFYMSLLSQSRSQAIPQSPDIALTKNLNTHCGLKNVRSRTDYNLTDGKLKIYSAIAFNSKGKPVTEKYFGFVRREYDVNNNLTATYISKNKEAEKLFEKIYFNLNGLVAKYESYENGILQFTYQYEYDATKRLVLEKDNCSSEKYTYNSKGMLIKSESVDCNKTASVADYIYNNQGLLSSITKDKVVTSTYNYVFQ